MDARLRGKLSRQDFKDIVFSDNFNVHIRFRENFNAEIENCIDACAQVYDRYKDLEKKSTIK